MKRGWVKDWRKDEDWRWHPLNMDRPFTEYEAFKDLIKLANHESRQVPIDGQYVTVERGQHLTSQKKLAKRWKWSRSKVHRYIKSLKWNQEADLKVNTRFTLITICNYHIYQSSEEPSRNSDETTMKLKRNSSGHKQELKELEELKKTTTTGDFVKFLVFKIKDRFDKYQVDIDQAVTDITDYVITHNISTDEIGALVYRWPERQQEFDQKQQEKTSDKDKKYGPAGITKV